MVVRSSGSVVRCSKNCGEVQWIVVRCNKDSGEVQQRLTKIVVRL